jgi:hypothetical protein
MLSPLARRLSNRELAPTVCWTRRVVYFSPRLLCRFDLPVRATRSGGELPQAGGRVLLLRGRL